jgi:hypothetical protein
MGKNIETYPYVVDKKYDTFEIHSYEASLFTAVKLSEFKEASSQGFSILAGYIFGGNKENEKIDDFARNNVSRRFHDRNVYGSKKFNKETLQSQADRRSNFDKNQQKLLLQSLLAVGLMTKIEKYKRN